RGVQGGPRPVRRRRVEGGGRLGLEPLEHQRADLARPRRAGRGAMELDRGVARLGAGGGGVGGPRREARLSAVLLAPDYARCFPLPCIDRLTAVAAASTSPRSSRSRLKTRVSARLTMPQTLTPRLHESSGVSPVMHRTG